MAKLYQSKGNQSDKIKAIRLKMINHLANLAWTSPNKGWKRNGNQAISFISHKTFTWRGETTLSLDIYLESPVFLF